MADLVLGDLDLVQEPVNCESVTLRARGGADGEGADDNVT
jgi:hypothetical protein